MGWPANGTSAPGLKIRRKYDAPSPDHGESGLGVVELAGQGQALLRGQVIAAVDDRELVAGEGPVGEDVHDVVGEHPDTLSV
ncbi:MAG TPA: hypothetical protein VK964_06455 [Nocardioidaceae bacterium]|nr:hypothetical protein [Nocardioidaceae bacterium]